MRVLVIFLLILGCRSGIFGGQTDDERRPAEPVAEPTSEPTSEPIAAPVLEVGSEDVTCKTSCASCSAWNWSEWLPATDSVCKGQDFKQQRTGARTCTGLCVEVKCLTSKTEEKDVVGTKQTTCAAGCSWGGWHAAVVQKQASEVCEGETFKQRQERLRTCRATCVDTTSCKMRDEQSIDVAGTKDCEDAFASTVTYKTCAEACEAWQEWSDWSPLNNASCPAVSSLTRPPDLLQTRNRSRACAIAGLRPGTKCPTSNTEQLRQPCPYCQGSGQILLSDGTCLQDVFLSDMYLLPYLNLAFSRLFNTMATRCSHPYTVSGNYSNSQWMLDRSGRYPQYCKEFNNLYDDLSWSEQEKARFRITYSVNPFKFYKEWSKNEKRIISLRNRKFDEAWSEHEKLYTWLTAYCAKSNDCLNFLFTPDMFVNLPNAQQEHWNDYRVLDDLLNTSPTMRKPLLMGGSPSYESHYGVYYKKDSFPATFRDYAKDKRDKCRKKWPNYQQLVKMYGCNPGKTGTWPCGVGETHKCSILYHRYTDKNGQQLERSCLFAKTPNKDLIAYGPQLRECFNYFWGFPANEP